MLSVTIIPNATSLPENILSRTQQIVDRNEVEIIDACSVLGSVIASDNAEKKFLE